LVAKVVVSLHRPRDGLLAVVEIKVNSGMLTRWCNALGLWSSRSIASLWRRRWHLVTFATVVVVDDDGQWPAALLIFERPLRR
jgi:hypothetical protein